MNNIFKISNFLIRLSLVMLLTNTMSYAQNISEVMLNDMDIPLMEGLVEDDNERVVFDSPDGSIISAQASGKVMAIKAYDYYRVVLPSLSWKVTEDKKSKMKCEDGALYCIKAHRGKENLILLFKADNQTSVVNYSISPF